MVSGNNAMVALLGHVLLAEHIMAAEKQMIHIETHVAFEDSVSVSFLHFCNCLHLLMLVIATFAAAKLLLFFELCKEKARKVHILQKIVHLETLTEHHETTMRKFRNGNSRITSLY